MNNIGVQPTFPRTIVASHAKICVPLGMTMIGSAAEKTRVQLRSRSRTLVGAISKPMSAVAISARTMYVYPTIGRRENVG